MLVNDRLSGQDAVMNIAVLGSGNGGCAVAFEYALNGHRVSLYGSLDYDTGITDVANAGGVTATGVVEGFGPLAYAGGDIAEALDGADVVFIVGPAFATEPLTLAAKPHLRPGQTIIVCPGSGGGAIVVKRALGLSLDDETYTVGETSTLPYAVRIDGPAHIAIFHKLTGGLLVSALPASGTGRMMEVLEPIYPGIEVTDSVFATTLQNGNPVIHPAVTLLNAALIERTGGDFKFYEEGVTPAVGLLMEAVDSERLALAEALGVNLMSEPRAGFVQGYMLEENYSTGYSKAPGFLGIGAQKQLDNRYLTEDVGYGLVFFTDLGRQIGVPTPAMDAVTTIASIIMERDFRSEAGRTMASLGLDQLTTSELAAL